MSVQYKVSVKCVWRFLHSTFHRIAQSTRNGNTYKVYNCRFYSDWSRSGALAQLSESVTLSSNETYLLQGVMKENSGVDFMKVS